METLRVLIADDEPHIRRNLGRLADRQGCEVFKAANGEEALSLLRVEEIDLLLLDLRMPGRGGMAALQEARVRWPDLSIVMITAHGSLEDGIEAMKCGAVDFLSKPYRREQIERIFERTRERKRLSREIRSRAHGVGEQDLAELIGESPCLRELRRFIRQAAGVKSSVLLAGETGTGKGLAARLIHRLGPRREFPYLAVNGRTLPPERAAEELFHPQTGVFRRAERGTVFLDEVTELPPAAQDALRQVLETDGAGAADGGVRVIAATVRDAGTAVREGRLEEGLYYRLSVLPFRLTPLRERTEDLPALAAAAVSRLAPGLGRTVREISPDYLECLKRYPFPGNVRELENLLERSLVQTPGDQLLPASLPAELRSAPLGGEFEPHGEDTLRAAKARALEAAESELIVRTLEENGYNVASAARQLQISRSALYYKAKQYGILLHPVGRS